VNLPVQNPAEHQQLIKIKDLIDMYF
jgi:hypothetical protein